MATSVLTKRDIMAALVLHGMLAGRNHNAPPYTVPELTSTAVKCADALIAELERDRSQEIL